MGNKKSTMQQKAISCSSPLSARRKEVSEEQIAMSWKAIEEKINAIEKAKKSKPPSNETV